jgi:hypothetical protein
MKRHKRYYFEPVEENPSLHRIVMIRRRPKKRSLIRTIMYWAWHTQSDKQFIKKYFSDETN